MPLIHHAVTGEGSPPLVFVHGFGCARADWDAQVRHLSGRYRCVAVDLRGHGDSPGTAAECSLERYGADVAEVMRALALPPAVIVGHSMGCRVVTEAALQAPDHTAGVILVDGSQFGAEVATVLKDRLATAEGYSTYTEGLFKDMFTAKSDAATAASVIVRARRLPREIGQKMLSDMVRYDTTRLERSFGGLRVPVMAIQTTARNAAGMRTSLRRGDTSPYLEMLRANVPGARVEIIEDTGHFPQLDESGQSNALIEAFLTGVAAG